MKRLCMLLLCGALSLGACSSGTESFATADDLASRLAEEGFSCDQTEDLPGGSLVKDSAACVTDEEGSLGLYIFATQDNMDDWLKVGARLGGVVTGDKWAVVAGDQASEVQEALGGETL